MITISRSYKYQLGDIKSIRSCCWFVINWNWKFRIGRLKSYLSSKKFINQPKLLLLNSFLITEMNPLSPYRVSFKVGSCPSNNHLFRPSATLRPLYEVQAYRTKWHSFATENDTSDKILYLQERIVFFLSH